MTERRADPWIRRSLAEALLSLDETLELGHLLREGKRQPADGWVRWSAVVEAAEVLASRYPGIQLSELSRRRLRIPLVPANVPTLDLFVDPHNLMRFIDQWVARPIFPHMRSHCRKTDRSTTVSKVRLVRGAPSDAAWWILHGALLQLLDRAGMEFVELRCEPSGSHATFTLIAAGTSGIGRFFQGARRALTRRAWIGSLVEQTEALRVELNRRQAAEALAVRRAEAARASQQAVMEALAAEEALSQDAASRLEPHVERLIALTAQFTASSDAELEPELTALVTGGVERLRLLQEGMTAWAALRSYVPAPVETDVSAICRDVISALAPRYPAPRQIDGPTEPMLATTDPELVYSLVEAIVDNALKFSTDTVVVALGASYTTLTLEVLDRGPGIPDDPAVTSAFRQGDNGIGAVGAGLGLAIAQRAVDLLGGRLTLDARDGGGAHVRVEIPRRSPAAPEPNTPG